MRDRDFDLGRSEQRPPGDRRAAVHAAPSVSVILLTFDQPNIHVVLGSLAQQQTDFLFEVIVADNGCLRHTVHAIQVPS